MSARTSKPEDTLVLGREIFEAELALFNAHKTVPLPHTLHRLIVEGRHLAAAGFADAMRRAANGCRR